MIFGEAGYDTIEGGIGWDKMYGGTGRDRIDGGFGNDLLSGGSGNDILTGGGGNDTFLFDLVGVQNADEITDFESGADKIGLDVAKAFGPLTGIANLSPAAFRIGDAALDGDDRIIYDQETGEMWYDADGNGVQEAQLFAKLAANTALSASDFELVNSSAATAFDGPIQVPLVSSETLMLG